MPSLREVRILVFNKGLNRSICKIAFSNKDGSIYILPYSQYRKFYSGIRSMKDIVFEDKFDFTKGVFSNITPKLSIHESGQVHVKVGENLIGPLQIPPLKDWNGEHLATICPDAISSLPEYPSTPKFNGQSIDQVFTTSDEIESLRLAIYLSSKKPSFLAQNCPIVFTLRRHTLCYPIFIAIKPIQQPPINVEAQTGITIITGWNFTNTSEQGQEYLYIRGE